MVLMFQPFVFDQPSSFELTSTLTITQVKKLFCPPQTLRSFADFCDEVDDGIQVSGTPRTVGSFYEEEKMDSEQGCQHQHPASVAPIDAIRNIGASGIARHRRRIRMTQLEGGGGRDACLTLLEMVKHDNVHAVPP